MARGIEINDKTRETIKALLATGLAKNQIAIKAKVSWATVDKVSKEEPDEIEDMREQKRQEFIDDLWSDIRAARILGRQKIDLATVALDEFKPTIDKLIDLLSDNEETNGAEIIELIKALSSITSIPLSHISTYIGTLYDKQALMTGGNTASVGVVNRHEYHIEQTITSDPESAKLLRQLYKRVLNPTVGDTSQT